MPSVQKSFITALAVATVLGLSACQPPAPKAADKASDKVVLKDTRDRVSYSIGFNFGKKMSQSMKQDNVDINPTILAQALTDAFADKPAMTEEEMKTTMTAFIAEMKGKQEAAAKAQNDKTAAEGDKNAKEGTAFLEANKAKEGVKTTPSGLQYKIISHGKGTKSPAPTDTVSANYRGTLVNGTEFDSSKGTPVSFPVNRVIPGWTEVLQLMKEGDKFQVFIPGNLAYGEHSPSPLIGANSTLVFDIELVSITKGSPAPAATPPPAPPR